MTRPKVSPWTSPSPSRCRGRSLRLLHRPVAQARVAKQLRPLGRGVRSHGSPRLPRRHLARRRGLRQRSEEEDSRTAGRPGQPQAGKIEDNADVSNGVRFHQAKVVKVIHEETKSLLICSDGVTIQATVVLDATGFSRCLVQYDKPYNPGYQVAYRILAEVEDHPFDLYKMVFMGWRDSHLKDGTELKERNSKVPTFLYAMPFSSTSIFLEETSLVACPGLQMEDIQERMVARLRHLGIKVNGIEEDDRCVIPMDGPLPLLPQRVVGIGGTAGMVHPSTGYMIARTLAAAPVVANSIVEYLGPNHGHLGDELLSRVWKDLWPIEGRRQREFCFGMDVLLKLDLQATRRFFDALFDLEPRYLQGFLSSRLFLLELVQFGLSLFSHASNTSRLEIMSQGSMSLVNMVSNLRQEKH